MLVVKFKLSESGRRCLTNHVIWNDWKWGKIQPLMNPIERNPRMKQGRYTQLRTYYPAKHGWKGDVAMKEGRKGGRERESPWQASFIKNGPRESYPNRVAKHSLCFVVNSKSLLSNWRWKIYMIFDLLHIHHVCRGAKRRGPPESCKNK